MSTEVEVEVAEPAPTPPGPPPASTAEAPAPLSISTQQDDPPPAVERDPSPFRPRGPPDAEALGPGLPDDLPFTPTQPGYSILLNGTTPSSHATRRASFASYTGPSGANSSYVTGFATRVGPSGSWTADALEARAAQIGQGPSGAGRQRADSAGSSMTDLSTVGYPVLRAGSVSGASTPSIRFAPLPNIPPELKRRSSITLGVAARKNLLSAQQGSAGLSSPGGGGGGVRMTKPMTDAEWDAYKAGFSSGGPEPLDVGEACKKGARALWSKIRPSSTSPSSPTPALPPKAGATPPRRSRPLSNSSAPSPTGSVQSFANGAGKLNTPLHVLHEEEHDQDHQHESAQGEPIQPALPSTDDHAPGSAVRDESEGADQRRGSTTDSNGFGLMTSPRGGSPPLNNRPVRQDVLGFVDPRTDSRPRRAPMSSAFAARQDKHKLNSNGNGNGNGESNGEGSRTPRRVSPPPSASSHSAEGLDEENEEGLDSVTEEGRPSLLSARSSRDGGASTITSASTPPRTPVKVGSTVSSRHRSGSYGSIELDNGGTPAAGRNRSGSKTGSDVANGLRYYLDRSMGT